MAVPTEDQIGKWRERWEKYPSLVDDIVSILMEDDRPPENAKETSDRLWRVNAILPEEDFDVYEGEGEYVGWYREEGEEPGSIKLVFIYGPVLDLRWINFSEKDLAGVFLGSAHLEGANLSWAHLEGANLGIVFLEGANLRSAKLEGAHLGSAHL
ncbi:pentapeptide repeat-containing protein, partial [bacterium]|nr:pentapeptide repeat-containing protein [bacterium]